MEAEASRWHLIPVRGSAADLHDRRPDATRPEVWNLTVTRPALVLGSTQDETEVVRGIGEGGFDLTRRRSGGGIVRLVPGEHVWLDVLMPRSHPAWDDDVHRAARWVGERWVGALEQWAADVEAARGSASRPVAGPPLGVHAASMVAAAAGRQVCFAGLGAGEVCIGDRKLVGISQRRDRWGARFQCIVHTVFDPDAHAAVIRPVRRAPDLGRRLAGVATLSDLLPGADPVLPAPATRDVRDRLAAALTAELDRSSGPPIG